MKLTIRTHTPGDIGWIISRHGEIYTREFDFDPDFEIHIANKFVHFFRKEKPVFDTVWIARIDKERVGSIAVSKKFEKKAFINFVLVSDNHRGHGIASKLFDTVIQHCKNYHSEVLELETYDCLKSARNLYHKLGFNITVVNKDVALFGQSLDQEFWQKKL